MAHLHGYEIAGEPRSPLLSAGAGARGRLRLESADAGLLSRRGRLTVLREDRAGASFAVARHPSGFIVWGRRGGAFDAEPETGRIRCERGGASAEAWGHQLGTVVVPLLLAERGAPALHAAALRTDAGAVVLTGPSGRGKSTTAMLGAAAGHAPLADDAVVFHRGDRGPEIEAGGAGLWTTPRAGAVLDSPAGIATVPEPAAAKDDRGARRIHGAELAQPSGPTPVAAIVVLAERGARLEVDVLSPAAALQRLAAAMLHVGDLAAMQRSFRALAAVLERVPCFEATLPEGLAEARPAVSDLLARVTAPPAAQGRGSTPATAERK